MKKYEHILAGVTLFLCITGLIPLMLLGRYNHPTGDDYFYGVETHHIWEETHNLLPALQEAAKGVAEQYEIWQGTYSAMFLMYLPPNSFGDTAYHLFTVVILLLLSGGIFYLSHQIFRGFLKASHYTWLTIASLVSMLCIQTIPFPEESFYWYNGAMYYTGFFAVSLFYFGLMCKYIRDGKKTQIVVLCLLAFFLAGGNYVSFLPTLLLTLAAIGISILCKKKKQQVIGLSMVSFAALIGFCISAMAPGNQLRQSGMGKIPPTHAIAKALIQGTHFLAAWTSLWCIIAFLLMAPLLWRLYEHSSFRFPYPLVVIGFAYGILCSSTCPTYYTMNLIGPARAVAIMYYMFHLFLFTVYAYGLGYLHRIVKEKGTGSVHSKALGIGISAAIGLCLLLQLFQGSFGECTAARAIRCLSTGEAAAYEQEYQNRLALLLDDSLKEVELTPYEHRADMLYVGDLSNDKTTPTNVRVAEFFHKISIWVNWDS
ncbi:MAG: hypothetical protein K6G30_02275 [Acetatifactor sp.]|nr:hypothetical protein [Acetatifactor sp.]